MSVHALVWLGIGVAAAIVEGLTAQLVSIWFAVGAAVTAFYALTGVSLTYQLVMFVLVSALTLVCMRTLLKKKMKFWKEPTNADRMIGQIAVILSQNETDSATGRAMVQGLDWSVRSAAGEPLVKGDKQIVRAIEGVTLILEPQRPEQLHKQEER